MDSNFNTYKVQETFHPKDYLPFGLAFSIFKLKRIHPKINPISRIKRFLRKTKLDELHQLLNVLPDAISVVGPRPYIPGFYGQLQGEARKILELKTGTR